LSPRHITLSLATGLAMVAGAFGQPSGKSAFASAQQAFEDMQYERALGYLEAHEKALGTSPRLESLRALALMELGKYPGAYKALRVYFRLIAGRDMGGNVAHQDLMKLRDNLAARMETEYKKKTMESVARREEEATQAMAELDRLYQSPEVRRAGSSAPPPAVVGTALERSAPPGSTLDALAELETWRAINSSAVAMDYFLFLETFPQGNFASVAKKKMHELGDPAWNVIRGSDNPFKFQQFVVDHPDSPFVDAAKARMIALATTALEWEKIKDSRDAALLDQFEARFPDHSFATEVTSARADILWSSLENSRDLPRIEEFLRMYPESRHSTAARTRLDALRSGK
jgi:hypothetical protein